ncbi:hypothetical protein IEQ34_026824 [Dendrobium chrysotoxum]|uniref:Uncharacterized protein n=1 Tax=Dendrobium chrysotoxum TaxID=161865 RepID=A0AAV7FLB2_DENCH|nr:hypothetical protein IEQ34_026824 [Dendrobium chrysotoxum]
MWAKKLVHEIKIRIGTWNIGSLTGKLIELIDIMIHRKINILCIQKTKWVGEKANEIDSLGFKLWFSGRSRTRNGIDVILDKSLKDNVININRIGDRIIALKIIVNAKIVNIISTYAPQVGLDMDSKLKFLNDLEELIQKIPLEERVFIGGDLNGHVGREVDDFKNIHGGHGFGTTNEGVMDVLTRHLQEDVPWGMLFADDILLVDKTREGVEGKLELWMSTLESKGFRLSRSKTEYMECNFSNNRPSEGIVTLADQVINKSTRFRYIGSIVQSDGEIDGDIISRIQVGWLKWRNASGLLCDRKVPLKLKGKFYKMVVRPAMLYGAECWPLKEKHNSNIYIYIKKKSVAEMRMLRWMSGFTLRDRIRNEHIREKVGVAPVEDKIRDSCLRWFGHIKRRPPDDPVRKVEVLDLTYVKKSRGRPKKTWHLHSSMRRRPGIAGLQTAVAARDQYRLLGENVAKIRADLMKEQLATFRSQLEEFAQKHKAIDIDLTGIGSLELLNTRAKLLPLILFYIAHTLLPSNDSVNDIRKNPTFRSQFHEMCAKVGVDPLASNKGFWAELLGIGDFYYELGCCRFGCHVYVFGCFPSCTVLLKDKSLQNFSVLPITFLFNVDFWEYPRVQIVEICLATRSHNGGLINLQELCSLLSQRRRTAREAISEDDCLRAISKLKVLGSGFAVISIGRKKLVRSVPTELNRDHNEILELAQGQGYVTVEEVEKRLSWSSGRAMDALETLLKEGLAMIDDGHRDGKRRYWFPCVASIFVTAGA